MVKSKKKFTKAEREAIERVRKKLLKGKSPLEIKVLPTKEEENGIAKKKAKKKDSSFRSLLSKKLKLKKILSKGKRATVVVNVPRANGSMAQPIFKSMVEQERRNLFFT